VVCEKRMLKEIFRPEAEEEIEGWRKLHSEEIHNNNRQGARAFSFRRFLDYTQRRTTASRTPL
jgi:hypothetical protein